MNQLILAMCKDINILPNELTKFVKNGLKKNHITSIPKKSGGTRKIMVPSVEIKIISYWVVINILKKLDIHSSATAFHKECNILKNVEPHSDNNFFIKLDIKEFFPSITYNIFLNQIKNDDKLNPNIKDFFKTEEIKSSIFYNGKCEIGLPCSPYIANYVMRPFDEMLTNELKKIYDGDYCYTRYADDMLISSRLKDKHQETIKKVKYSLKEIFEKKIVINNDKTRKNNKKSGRIFVTGLRICKSGRITLHRKYKDHVRLLLSLMQKNNLAKEDIETLPGHLSYISSVDSKFYNKIFYKYKKVVEKL